jgi:putative ABC transport system ATP-binding protein
MEMFSRLNEAGTTINMVTNSLSYAEYGNRVVHLFDGHIVTENMKGKFHV